MRAAPADPQRQIVELSEQERADLGMAGQDRATPPAAAAATTAPYDALGAPAAGAPKERPAAPAVRDIPSTFEDLEAALAATQDREEIGRLLLGYLAGEYRRVALFQVTRQRTSSWMAHGEGIDQEAFSRFSAGFDQPSIFLNLRHGSSLYLGPLPPMEVHRELALTWGGGLPRDCVVLPVRLRDRLVTVIYADGAVRGLAGLDLERLHRLTAATAAAFERCIVSRRRAGTSV